MLPRATKKMVKEAVQKFYKGTTVKRNIGKIPAKKRVSQMRGVSGVKSGGKKHMYFLKRETALALFRNYEKI